MSRGPGVELSLGAILIAALIAAAITTWAASFVLSRSLLETAAALCNR
jgi:hypothetical protein